MSAYYGRLQRLVHQPGSRVTHQSRISQFNTKGRVRGVRGRGIGNLGIGYGPGHDHGCGG